MTTSSKKKKPCPDCRECQGCSESRCRVCRKAGRENPLAGLSMQQQIELYDSINRRPRCNGDGGCGCA